MKAPQNVTVKMQLDASDFIKGMRRARKQVKKLARQLRKLAKLRRLTE